MRSKPRKKRVVVSPSQPSSLALEVPQSQDPSQPIRICSVPRVSAMLLSVVAIISFFMFRVQASNPFQGLVVGWSYGTSSQVPTITPSRRDHGEDEYDAPQGVPSPVAEAADTYDNINHTGNMASTGTSRDGRRSVGDKRFLGDYGLSGGADNIQELRKGMEDAKELLMSGGRYWTGGGVAGASIAEVEERYNVIFKSVLSRLDHSRWRLSEVKPGVCVASPEHFASAQIHRKKMGRIPDTLSYQFMNLALETLHTEGSFVPPDCSITMPPGFIASCLVYAFSTMRGRDLALFMANDSHTEKPSIFKHLSRFRHSHCAKIMPCALWTSGEVIQRNGSTDREEYLRASSGDLPRTMTVRNVLRESRPFRKAVETVLGHFGAHVGNLREVDQLFNLKKELFYTSMARYSDVAPLAVAHRTGSRMGNGTAGTSALFDKEPGSGGELRAPLYVSVDSETELLSVGTSPKALSNETVSFPQMSSETVYKVLRMASLPDFSQTRLQRAASRDSYFPRLLAFFGDSVERATYFALVASLRRGPEFLRYPLGASQENPWSRYAPWSTSGMYDGRILHVVFNDCDTLITTFVYPFMNPDENGNGPMQPEVKASIETAVDTIINANHNAYTVKGTRRLVYGARDIIRSVLSPIRVGESQVLQLATLKWYIGLLRRLCDADPTPTRQLCPKLLVYFEFDMKANLPNVALLQDEGADIFFDLWKNRSCKGQAVVNPHLRPLGDEGAPTNLSATGRSKYAVSWDATARSVVEVGVVMTSFGFWEHLEPMIVDRLHGMYTGDFNVMLMGQRVDDDIVSRVSPETLYMHRISTVYHHQKGRDRPYYEAFRHAFQTESTSIFEDWTAPRDSPHGDVRSNLWVGMRTNLTFTPLYDTVISEQEKAEVLPVLVLGHTLKGKRAIGEQDNVLPPEQRTREGIPFQKRDKEIAPKRMTLQIQRMLVEGWAAVMHLSMLVLDLTYNVLQIGPLPPVPRTVATMSSYQGYDVHTKVPAGARHLPHAGNPISMDPIAQSKALFQQYKYTADAYGSVLMYSNGQRSDAYASQSEEVLRLCPAGGAFRGNSSSSPWPNATRRATPPNVWAFDASIMQTLYPFTGTDIVHTDCHFNLNARRAERTRSASNANHVLMADWGYSSFFTSMHPMAGEDGYEEGLDPRRLPSHKARRSWSTIEPVCLDDPSDDEDGGKANGTRPIVTSIDVAIALERRYVSNLYHHIGCEGNWTVNPFYRMAATRTSLVDSTVYKLAPPECSLMIGQTLNQCRNVMAENENYLRLLHIMRARTSRG